MGSELSLIKQSDAVNLVGNWDQSETLNMSGFGGAKVQALGQFKANVDIQGVVASIKLVVVPDVYLKCSLLIGQNYTELPFIQIIKTNSQLIVSRKDPEPVKIKLWVSNDCELQPGVNAIVVHCDAEYTGAMLVDGSIRSQPHNEHLLEEGVYSLKAGKGIVMITNITNKALPLRENQLLTRAQTLQLVTSKNVSVNEIKIVEPRTPFTLSEIKVSEHINDNQKQELLDLLNKYRTCFANSLNELGCTSIERMNIELTDSQPVVYRPYRLSHAERAEVRDMTKELLQCGIIRESSSPFASPIILVQKKTGDKRLCIDYRALNRKTIKQHYPLPRIEDQMDRLAGYSLYTSLDLASGYYQIELTESAKEKTAFVTPDGQFEFNRMPFGLTNAPAIFQRVLNKVLDHLRFNTVVLYMDDILLPSHTFTDGMQKLEAVLDKIKNAGLTLKLGKCDFFQPTILFLGFEVSREGIRPGKQKTEAVKCFPEPKNVHNVRQFLGLASFFRRFIQNFAGISRPMSKLLKKNQDWQWGPEQIEAFQKLRDMLVSRPILALFDQKATTELHTDASKHGVGGILLQKQVDGALKPVAYYSRQTSPEEQHFTSYELETLAVISSLVKFRPYLLGMSFTVVTDCNSLRATFLKRDMIPRVARWWSLIQEFDCNVVYRPGTAMSHVDALSRNPISTDSQGIIPNDGEFTILHITADWLTTVQADDDEIQRIKRIIDSETQEVIGVKQNYCIKRGMVYKKTDDGPKWLVPKAVRWQILRACHDNIGHFSYEKTLDKIKSDYWFPKMAKFVKKYCRACLKCAHGKVPAGKKSGYLHPIPKEPKPFHTLHADHLGPFNESKKKNKYILVIIDSFTKFVIIKAVKNTKTSTTITVFKEYFSIFGVPFRLITDRGTTFTSSKFKQFLSGKSVHHVLNSVATPRANGQVERYNRSILDSLTTMIQGEDERLWDEHLYNIQWGLNNTLNKSTGKTPAEVLFGLRLTGTNESEIQLAVQNVDSNLNDDNNLNDIRSAAQKKTIENQSLQKKRFDKNRFKPRTFQVGQLVRVEREVSCKGKSKKLVAKCLGPYRIAKIMPNDRYEIVDTPLTQKKGKPKYSGVFPVDKIYPWLTFKPVDSDKSSDDSETDELE